MPYFIEFLLKASLGLTFVYLFYYLVLSRHTFYTWNRWYLRVFIWGAFIIPCIDISPAIQTSNLGQTSVVQMVPSVSAVSRTITNYKPIAVVAPIPEAAPQVVNYWSIISYIFLAGIIVLLIRFGLQILSFIRIKRRARIIYFEGITIHQLDEDIIPFSFWNSIFMNTSKLDNDEIREIILHELVHIEQKHSVDIIWAELLCVFNWFNPFVWLISRAIRQNLEYIADKAVLDQGVEAKSYQYLLLKAIGIPKLRVANQFNFSSLKKRIVMMNKANSGTIHLAKFVFVLPLVAVTLLMCRNNLEIGDVQKEPFIKFEVDNGSDVYSGIILDSKTQKPLEGVKLKIRTSRVAYSKLKAIETETSLVYKEYENQSIVVLDSTYLKTDADGFYFWKSTLENPDDSTKYEYSLVVEDSRYESKNMRGSVPVIMFVNKAGDVNTYSQSNHLMELLDKESDESVIKEALLAELPKYAKNQSVTVRFRNRVFKPSQVISKFEDAYFNKKRNLVGYEGDLKFYLDGQEVSYEKINEVFKYIAIGAFQEDMKVNSNDFPETMRYYTAPTYRDAPPVQLLSNENVKWFNPDNFNMDLLDKETFYIDGFWQVAGIGSNLKPEKRDIKRVAEFSGRLAHYYNPTKDKLLWIETSDDFSRIMERPDFAHK